MKEGKVLTVTENKGTQGKGREESERGRKV